MNAGALKEALSGSILVEWNSEGTSTMDLARSYISSKDGNLSVPSVFILDRQSAGRGRHGRVWESAGSNLYLTLVTSAQQNTSQNLSGLSLVVGLVVAELLKLWSIPVELKWPNDILCGPKKVGGILIEVHQHPDLGGLPLIGLGLNIDSAPDGVPEAGVLPIEFTDPDKKVEFVASLIKDLLQATDEFYRDGFTLFRERYLDYAAYINRNVQLKLPDGEVTGLSQGVAEDGALCLSVDGAERRFYSVEQLRLVE